MLNQLARLCRTQYQFVAERGLLFYIVWSNVSIHVDLDFESEKSVARSRRRAESKARGSAGPGLYGMAGCISAPTYARDDPPIRRSGARASIVRLLRA
jgi:hypothetical protein